MTKLLITIMYINNGDFIMRTYYLLKINKYFAYIYKKWPYKMYKIIEELYYTKDYDMLSSYRYYKKFAIEFDKNSINDYIYSINKTNRLYYRDNSTHILNNDNYNKLLISKTCLILRTDDMYSLFLQDISNYTNNIFICDFKNKDYFWLDNLKNNVIKV